MFGEEAGSVFNQDGKPVNRWYNNWAEGQPDGLDPEDKCLHMFGNLSTYPVGLDQA